MGSEMVQVIKRGMCKMVVKISPDLVNYNLKIIT